MESYHPKLNRRVLTDNDVDRAVQLSHGIDSMGSSLPNSAVLAMTGLSRSGPTPLSDALEQAFMGHQNPAADYRP